MRPLIIILAALLVVTIKASTALAQTGSLPPGVTVDSNGNYHLNTNVWTPGEPVFIQPDGLPSIQVELPGGGAICAACFSFNTYSGPNGETIVVPNTYTAVMMAVTGQNPFNTQPDGYVLSGLLQIPAVLGVFEEMGVTPEQFMDPQQWSPDPMFWLQLNLELSGLWDPNEINENTLFLATGLFSFNAGNCPPALGNVCTQTARNSNSGNGGDDPFERICLALGDCKPLKPDICADGRNLTIDAPRPQYQVDQYAPENPVVVGQDESARGADLRVSATVPPVVVSFNNTIRQDGEQACTWVGGGQGGGCGNWGGKTNYSAGFQPWMASDPDWGVVTEEHWICVRDSKTYFDRIALFTVNVELTAESAAWITSGDLQQRYPGARVYQAHWPLWPGLAPTLRRVSSDQTAWFLQWERIPFRDPGKYQVSVGGQTSGTPYTAPRNLRYDNSFFDVALFEAALIK